MWLSLVERCVRDAEAAGSNPVASTINRQVSFETCRFSFLFHPIQLKKSLSFASPGVMPVCFL